MAHKESETEQRIGYDTFAVKMRFNKPIPQFLPVYGKKLRIYYPGIKQACKNYYGAI